VQVSNGGGNFALWSRTKNELYHAGIGQVRLMAVPYTVGGAAFLPSKPRVWSETEFSTPPMGQFGQLRSPPRRRAFGRLAGGGGRCRQLGAARAGLQLLSRSCAALRGGGDGRFETRGHLDRSRGRP
jgi:hypothetical protein